MPWSGIEPALDDREVSRFIWNESREGWALVDPNTGIMRCVNPAFAKMLGYGVPELEGRSFQSITVDSDIAPDEAQLKRLAAGEISQYEMVKTYRTKHLGTATCRLRAIDMKTGILVAGTILPIDTLSLEHLPDTEAKRVLSMLIGRWAIEHWRAILVVFLVVVGVMRIDDIVLLLTGGKSG